MHRLAVVALAVLAAGCGGSHRGAAVSPCAGAGFVGGHEKADGMFAARIPMGCADRRARSCTVADGHGPIVREVVAAGVVQDCFAFNQFVGSGMTQIPGYAAGECFGVAVLRGVPGVVRERPTFRCDGGRAPRSNAGTRMPVTAPARGSTSVEGAAADPWPHPPEAGAVGERRLAASPLWALLVWRDARGRACYEPGQVVDRHTPGRADQLPGIRHPGGAGLRGRLVGSLRYDSRSGTGIQFYGVGRFSAYEPAAGGSCGRPAAGIGPLASWESRYARRDQAFAVTVVSGIAGPRVRSVAVRIRGRWSPRPLSARRAFLWAARGVRGPAELPVRVTYVDGSVRVLER
jgi:hypothetical protein